MSNSLLGDWTGPFELPPFAAIRDEEFAPAFEAALTQGRAAIAAIADGAVVGSAIVSEMAAGKPVPEVLAFVKSLADGAHSA